MGILQIVFLLSVCGCLQPLRLPISDILEIAKLSKDVTIDLFKTFALVDEDVGLSPNASKSVRQSILLEEFKVLKNKTNMFNAQLGSKVLDAMVLWTNIPLELKRKLDEVNVNIYYIHYEYEDMGALRENKTAFEDFTLEESARSIVSDSNDSIQIVLDEIHAIIAPSEDGVPSVFHILYEIMKVQGNEMFCKTKSSAQQLILYLYNTLALTELKGFLMIELSYMLLKLDNQGNFTKEMEAAQDWHKYRSATTLKLTIEAVQSAPREFWKCDPYKQVKNETYIEITELIQGYIESEEDIGKEWACRLVIKDSLKYKSNKCDNERGQNMFCIRNRQCKGDLLRCRPITRAESTVCFADGCTNRRYEYISQGGKSLGRMQPCANNSVRLMGKWSFAVYCDYFMCLCDEQGVNSDRYFSLFLEQSDLHDNMVVTGLRFVKQQRIIYLQIQQGKLLPMGKINVTSVRWKPVRYFRINDKGMQNGRDYHTLTWDKRGLDLDDIVVNEGKVLTGVRFALNGSLLQLQIHTTPFNFRTGTLDVKESVMWYIPRKNRKKIDTDNKDVPILDPDSFGLLSKPGMYLEFTHSDMVMDMAQTTVPFIDAQDVTLGHPVPLSGAGIIYRGSKKFGGFITLKVTTYNFKNILRNTYNDHNYIYL